MARIPHSIREAAREGWNVRTGDVSTKDALVRTEECVRAAVIMIERIERADALRIARIEDEAEQIDLAAVGERVGDADGANVVDVE